MSLPRSAHLNTTGLAASAQVLPHAPGSALGAAIPSYSLPQLWHLLSLDAPTVAVLWTFFVARSAGVMLPWHCLAGLFVAVWMLYALDRLLDAWPSRRSAPQDLEERHRFHWRHRDGFLPALVAGGLTVLLLLPGFGAPTLRLYGLLSLGLCAWLLLIHLPQGLSSRQRRLPKESVVGVFFALAVAVPTVARAPWLWGSLSLSLLLFAAVCSLNCLLLYAWEHETFSHVAEDGQAHASTRWAIQHLNALGIVVLAGSLCIAFHMLRLTSPGVQSASLAQIAFACALAVLLLLLLHRFRRLFRPLSLRVAADVCLLTPLFFLLAVPSAKS